MTIAAVSLSLNFLQCWAVGCKVSGSLLELVFHHWRQKIAWSSGRVADRDGFENRFTLTGNGGSNPSCSGLSLIAIFYR